MCEGTGAVRRKETDMTQREAVYAMMRGEKPHVIINGWEPFQLVFDDLVMHCNPPVVNGRYVDCWGVTMLQEEGQPGAMPSEDPALLPCTDITEWRSQVKVPDVMGWELDWTGAFAQKKAAEDAGKIGLSFLPMGVFEISHNILGFEEALVDYLAEPDDMHDLIETIFEYKKQCITRQIEAWQPEGFLLHDDWGSKANLLLDPDTWREYFKEGYRELYRIIHDSGAFVMMHSDSNNALIAADMEEIGVDIWQGALPTVDIAGLQKKLPGRMIFMGGFDSGVIDRADSTKEEIRADVLRACREYLPGGKYIPCITYGGPGSLFPGVDDTITEVIRGLKYADFV